MRSTVMYLSIKYGNKIPNFCAHCIGEICKAENDTVWNIAWPNTTVGSIATQKCPGFSESIGMDIL